MGGPVYAEVVVYKKDNENKLSPTWNHKVFFTEKYLKKNDNQIKDPDIEKIVYVAYNNLIKPKLFTRLTFEKINAIR